MKTRTLTLGLAPALALAACGGHGDDAANTDAADMTNAGLSTDTPPPGNEIDNVLATGETVAPAQDFANKVGASDYFEIEAGKIAQDRTHDAKLKAFAAMIVADHTDSTEKLKAVSAGLDPEILPNPALDAQAEADLAALRDAKDEAFDALFKTQQIAAHERALTVLQGYASTGDVDVFKTFATEASKVVQAHLTEIRGS
jgi:putative membrane protein